MNLKDLEMEEIKGYIRAERNKGRSMREIVQEVALARDDVTILSHNARVARQQLVDSIERRRKA